MELYWTGAAGGNYGVGTQSDDEWTSMISDTWGGTLTLEGSNPTVAVGDTVTLNRNGDLWRTGTYAGYVTIGGENYPLLYDGMMTLLLGLQVPDNETYQIFAAAICYLRGTRILTARGEIPIEQLASGDLVATRFGGLRPVRWIGRQSFDGRFLGHANAPVRFRPGALGQGMPCRDLWVSADHSMEVDGHLVPARLLVNGVSVIQAPVSGTVELLHVDLGPHDLVLADGAWCESYAEMGNRKGFHNHATFTLAAAPQPMCLPQVGGEDPRLPALRARMIAHLDAADLLRDPGLHLLADATPIAPQIVDGAWRFDVPAGTTRLRLRSHSLAPATLGANGDTRLLGVRIDSLAAIAADGTPRIADPGPAEGWYATEPGGHRWTNGDADLCSLLTDSQSLTLTMRGAAMPAYLLPAPPLARAA